MSANEKAAPVREHGTRRVVDKSTPLYNAALDAGQPPNNSRADRDARNARTAPIAARWAKPAEKFPSQLSGKQRDRIAARRGLEIVRQFPALTYGLLPVEIKQLADLLGQQWLAKLKRNRRAEARRVVR